VSPNASGIASATTRNAAIPVTRRPRRRVEVGVTALVSHAYPLYIHQITPSMSTTRPSDAKLKSVARTAVSWVTVNTNTRSKNSSSVDTRTTEACASRDTYMLRGWSASWATGAA
jgi:hypothetical protein